MEVRWTEEKASYESKFINFSEMVTSPKPVQKKSHPLIILGEICRMEGSGRLTTQIGDYRMLAVLNTETE